MLRFGTREIALSAVLAALVCATTLLIQIPIPATQGFFNVGDAMVKVASSIEEFTELLESGFEYVSDYEGRKVLRKRK
jgi:hypothetical protein